MKVFDAGSNAEGFTQTEIKIHRHYIKHLRNHNGLQPIVTNFVRHLRLLMMRKDNNTLSEWKSTGLLELSHWMLHEPSTLALFGEIDPRSIEKDFRLFDNKIHFLTAYLPSWINRIFFHRELQARYRLNNSWLKKRHATHDSDFIRDRTNSILDHPEWFSQQEYGGKQTFMLWASLANSIPALFWSLLYILHDSTALISIREEIDRYLPICSIENDSLVDEWTLDRLALCVNLDSAVNEDKRIVHLKENDAVALFPTIAHHDLILFPHPDDFIFDRFIRMNADNTLGFMPFGIGSNICPGRYFIRSEIKVCIAMFFRYMDYELNDAMALFTKQKSNRVGLGIAPPNQDVTIMYRYKQ